MTRINYPSEFAPGPVPVSLKVPEGWQIEPAPEVAFVVTSPEETDGVRVNAVVSVRRIDGGTAVADLADLIAAEADGISGAELSTPEEVRFGEVDGLVFVATLADPTEPTASETVCQLYGLCVVPVSPNIADAVIVVVTYPGSADPEAIAGYRRLVESLRAG